MGSSQIVITRLVTKELKALSSLGSSRRLFRAVLSAEALDKQNEMILIDELEKVLPIWFARGAPIMDTHTNRHVGKGNSFDKIMAKIKDANGRETGEEVPAIVVTGEIFKDYQLDNEIWEKIKTGEYAGVSFGGATKGGRTPIKLSDGRYGYQLGSLEQYEMSVCFLAGTEILMGDETKKYIEEVKVGDYVIGHDGKSHRVIHTMKRKYSGWIHKVTPAGRWIGQPKGRYARSFKPLCVTPEHPLMMEDGSFKAVKDLRKDDRVRTMWVIWNKGKFDFMGSQKSAYKQNLESYQRRKELERIECERGEFEKQGFRFVTIAHHAIPDAIAIKDGKVLAVEVQYGRSPNYQKYLTFKHDYDDVVWIRRTDAQFRSSVKSSICRINNRGVKAGFDYNGDVYNLEVEDVHTYVANNFVVHNCKSPANQLSLIVDYNSLAKSMSTEALSNMNMSTVNDAGDVKLKCNGVVCFVEKQTRTYEVAIGNDKGIWHEIENSFSDIVEARNRAMEKVGDKLGERYQIFEISNGDEGDQKMLVEDSDLPTVNSYLTAMKSLEQVLKPNDKRPPKKWWNQCVESTGGKEALCGWVFYHKLGGSRQQATANASKTIKSTANENKEDKGVEVEVSPENQSIEISIQEDEPENIYSNDFEFDESLLADVPESVKAMFINESMMEKDRKMTEKTEKVKGSVEKEEEKREANNEDKEDKEDYKGKKEMKEMKEEKVAEKSNIEELIQAVGETLDKRLGTFKTDIESMVDSKIAKIGVVSTESGYSANAKEDTKEVKPNRTTTFDNKPYNNPENDTNDEEEGDDVALETGKAQIKKSYTGRTGVGSSGNEPSGAEEGGNPILKMYREGKTPSEIAMLLKSQDKVKEIFGGRS